MAYCTYSSEYHRNMILLAFNSWLLEQAIGEKSFNFHAFKRLIYIVCNCQLPLIPDPRPISTPDDVRMPCFDVITEEPEGVKCQLFPTLVHHQISYFCQGNSSLSHPALKCCFHP